MRIKGDGAVISFLGHSVNTDHIPQPHGGGEDDHVLHGCRQLYVGFDLQRVGAKGHMRSVPLGTADRQDAKTAALFDGGFHFVRTQKFPIHKITPYCFLPVYHIFCESTIIIPR